MNIFILDDDLTTCAQYHNDNHLTKMLIETCQILCAVHHLSGTRTGTIPYKKTHSNHPCTRWAFENIANYDWLLQLGYELEKERNYRGFNPSGKLLHVLNWCKNNKPNIKHGDITTPAQAMPDKYRQPDIIKAYQDYYVGEKQGYLISSTNKRKKTMTKKWKQSS